MENKPELVAEFKCPVCTLRELLATLVEGLEARGVPEPFTKAMADMVKAQGWMHPDITFYLQIWQGAVYDPAWVNKIPKGSKLPAYHVYLNVCSGCGCIYASKLEKSIGVKRGGPQVPSLVIPKGVDLPEDIKKSLEGIDFSKLDKGAT